HRHTQGRSRPPGGGGRRERQAHTGRHRARRPLAPARRGWERARTRSWLRRRRRRRDRKSTRLNSSHVSISYAVFCLKKKTNYPTIHMPATLNSCEFDKTYLHRDTSHRLSPTHKAPYAPTILMPQNSSIAYCRFVICP